MAQQECASGLLLVDISGLTQDSGLLRRLSLRQRKTAVVVKRGELVTLVRPAVKREGTTLHVPDPHNYQLEGNPAVTLNCGHKDIAVVNDHELQLLKAISQKEERLRVYTEGLLEWGAELKPSDPVYVNLSSAVGYSHTVRIVTAGVVRYVGPVNRQPGIQFGVEIVEQEYRGRGSSGDQYFSCDHNCAMFVSLDKLHRPSTSAAAQERSRENDVDPSTLCYERTVVEKNTVPDPNERCRELEDCSLHRTISQLEHTLSQDEFHTVSQDGDQALSQGEFLEVQSRIQILCPEPEEHYIYGVIRWIGALPKKNGTYAGIELDEAMPGGTNGTHKKSKKKYFSCPSGRGLYYPLWHLVPDTRFVDQEAHLIKNPLEDVQDEVLEDQVISKDQYQKYIGDERGIQGHYNSCFLDATVFGLFALSDAFDHLFLEKCEDEVGRNVAHLLWKGIVNPLRKNHIVKYDSVMRLRDELERVGRLRGITQEEKDPEEFLNMLFKYTLQVPPFISIRRPFGVEEEYFVQLFMEPDESLKLPSVGELLEKMFREQSISFTEAPSRLLIQVPRFGKQFKTFQNIVPELIINTASLVDGDSTSPDKCTVCERPAEKTCTECTSHPPTPTENHQDHICYFCGRPECWDHVHQTLGEDRHEAAMWEVCGDVKDVRHELELLSVICIETSHYVCFTRSEDKWVFFDSMANRVYDKFNIPKVVDCADVLNEWVYPADGDRSRLLNTPPRNLPEYVRRFTQDIYLCVYIRTKV